MIIHFPSIYWHLDFGPDPLFDLDDIPIKRTIHVPVVMPNGSRVGIAQAIEKAVQGDPGLKELTLVGYAKGPLRRMRGTEKEANATRW